MATAVTEAGTAAGTAPVAAKRSTEPMIQIRGLNHWFGSGDTRKQGLADNTLTLMPSEMVVMTGPSGSGKTTILTLIGGLKTAVERSARGDRTEVVWRSARAHTCRLRSA